MAEVERGFLLSHLSLPFLLLFSCIFFSVYGLMEFLLPSSSIHFFFEVQCVSSLDSERPFMLLLCLFEMTTSVFESFLVLFAQYWPKELYRIMYMIKSLLSFDNILCFPYNFKLFTLPLVFRQR